MLQVNKDEEVRQIINGLRAITSADRRLSQHLAKTYRITARQLGAVRIVASSPGISLGDLADRMYLHISTGSGIIDRLEKKRLLVRRRCPKDHRIVQLYATPQGSRITKAIPMTGFGFLVRDINALRAGELRAIWVGMRGLLRLLRLEKELTRVD